jgi:ElaB/YqjD/DUF883 family membrane-anchored ribosome-binding protein
VAQRLDTSEAASNLREELAQLRADIDSLVGTVGRLAQGAAGTLSEEAKRTLAEARRRSGDAFDSAVSEGKRGLNAAEHGIQSHPFLSIAIAAGIGLLIGRLFSRD